MIQRRGEEGKGDSYMDDLVGDCTRRFDMLTVMQWLEECGISVSDPCCPTTRNVNSSRRRYRLLLDPSVVLRLRIEQDLLHYRSKYRRIYTPSQVPLGLVSWYKVVVYMTLMVPPMFSHPWCLWRAKNVNKVTSRGCGFLYLKIVSGRANEWPSFPEICVINRSCF